MPRFTDSAAAVDLAERAERLMEEVVLPKERSLTGGTTVSRGTVRELREAAREYGVYAPQIDEEWGGMGYSFRDVLPTFEQAGRSSLGATAMRVDANGIGEDLPLADFYESVRPFRIVDGADEVHRSVIARDEFGSVDDAELEALVTYDESL